MTNTSFKTIKQIIFHEKPTTPSKRGVVKIKKKFLWKGSPERKLTHALKNTGGRNNRGVITCQGRINVQKRKYRIIDFNRSTDFIGNVTRLEYDPNRTAHIALVEGRNKSNENIKKYIIATENMHVGEKVAEGSFGENLEGHCLKLFNINVGSKVHNIELRPDGEAKIVRSAGSFATLVSKQEGYAEIRLPSKEIRRFSLECRATIGIVSNGLKYNVRLGKAGHTINTLRRRSKVRGVAKNPIDHRNGGKTAGGKVFTNFKGSLIKGQKTRPKNKFSNNLIVARRVKKHRSK